MAVYSIGGAELSFLYDVQGASLSAAYDINGNRIFGDEIPVDPDDPYIPGRTLVFVDDFNSFDPSMWMHEIGNVRNYSSELQCYRAENVSFEDSCLVLTAKRETYGGKEWTSGSISGQTIQRFRYGRFEAKIKFPNVVGAFGAFWMAGSNFWKEYVDGGRPTNHGVIWPACGEIDTAEGAPGNAAQVQSILWDASDGNSLGLFKSGTVDQSEWNIYALEWTPEYMASSVNGVEFARWTFSNFTAEQVQAYQLPFYMILNLAVGSSGGIPASTTNEMKMYVDWVRVYSPLTN